MKPEATKNGYKHVLIDNTICKRRFHIEFEADATPEKIVHVDCPHCGVTIFTAHDHPPAMLAREENLVKSPDGSFPLIHQCRFHAQ